MLKLESKPGIYLLTNKINGKIYVGKSINLKDRIRHYYHTHKEKNNPQPIISAIKKYGWENFEISILETFNSISNEDLLDIESEWIIKLHSTDKDIGYNIVTYSSDQSGVKRSAETRAKLSKIMKEQHRQGLFLHHVVSDETKHLMSEKAKERYKLYGSPNVGRKCSEEKKEKIRQAHLGRISPKRKAVEQIDIQTGEIIKIWDCAGDAALHFTGNKKLTSSIAVVCNGYLRNDKSGVYRSKTAYGFKWEYVKK